LQHPLQLFWPTSPLLPPCTVELYAPALPSLCAPDAVVPRVRGPLFLIGAYVHHLSLEVAADLCSLRKVVSASAGCVWALLPFSSHLSGQEDSIDSNSRVVRLPWESEVQGTLAALQSARFWIQALSVDSGTCSSCASSQVPGSALSQAPPSSQPA
jgi:hypothetical protein